MERESKKSGISILVKAIYYKTNSKRNGKNWLLIISCIFLLNSCVKKSEPVRILFVGDILLSRNVKEEYSTRNTFPWEKLETLFQSADLVIGNLEGAVGNSREQINPLVQLPVFAIDSSDIELLVKAGFSAMTVENNHSLDLGIKGKTKTISTLAENNIKSISLENSPYFFNTKGCIISIIAINLVMNRDSSKYEIPSIEIKQKLRLARALSNIVIVSVHWGSELLEWPNNEQRKAAKWLISNGTDLIIGHHPHVIQKPELIDGKPVYFSLGNHLFDQKYSSTKEGLIAEIEIKNGKIYCNGIKTRNQKNSFYPEIQGASEQYFEPNDYRKQIFTINSIGINPENIDVVNKIVLKAFAKDKLLWKSHPMSLVALQKIKIDENEEHLFSLESYYSSIDKEINIRPYVYKIDNKGIIAQWRGSALAWPILDAQISPYKNEILCALHRGDAFIMLGKTAPVQKVAAYKWNGFGFDFITDSTICRDCERIYK
jgi:hypothetical protein